MKFYVGEEQEPVDILIRYDVKLKTLSMTHKKRKELRRNVKMDQLCRDPTMLVLGEYKMKVRTLLAMSKDKFNVTLNDVDMFLLKRYQK